MGKNTATAARGKAAGVTHRPAAVGLPEVAEREIYGRLRIDHVTTLDFAVEHGGGAPLHPERHPRSGLETYAPLAPPLIGGAVTTGKRILQGNLSATSLAAARARVAMERLVALVVLAAAARARVVPRPGAHLERDFALCVGEISVKDEYRTVRFAPEESGPAAAGRLMRAAGVTEDAAFDASVRNIGAFLEHRASLALMERSEFRHALPETQRVGAPALFLTSQACAEGAAPLVNAILDRHAPWAMLDLNHFNADRGSDWRFYFGDRPVAAVAIGCQATRPLDDAALRRVVDHAAKHLLPGAVLQLVVDEARYDAVAALVEAAGFSDVGGVDAAIHGPAPRACICGPWAALRAPELAHGCLGLAQRRRHLQDHAPRRRTMHVL